MTSPLFHPFQCSHCCSMLGWNRLRDQDLCRWWASGRDVWPVKMSKGSRLASIARPQWRSRPCRMSGAVECGPVMSLCSTNQHNPLCPWDILRQWQTEIRRLRSHKRSDVSGDMANTWCLHVTHEPTIALERSATRSRRQKELLRCVAGCCTVKL